MTLDPKVHDLAVAWLSDQPATWRQAARVTSLARTIQSAIEAWCEEEAERDPRDDDAHERAAARARDNYFADTGGKD